MLYDYDQSLYGESKEDLRLKISHFVMYVKKVRWWYWRKEGSFCGVSEEGRHFQMLIVCKVNLGLIEQNVAGDCEC